MENKFIALIKETLDIEDRELQMPDKYREYPEWNSLGLLSVIAAIDEEYDVVIEGKIFQQLQTLQELYTEIQKRV